MQLGKVIMFCVTWAKCSIRPHSGASISLEMRMRQKYYCFPKIIQRKWRKNILHCYLPLFFLEMLFESILIKNTHQTTLDFNLS